MYPKVPVSDIIVKHAKDKMKLFVENIKKKELEHVFKELVKVLVDMDRLHFIGQRYDSLPLVVGIDGAYVIYNMFGGIVGMYVTVGAFIRDGEVFTDALDTDVDVFLGEKGENTFRLIEYIAELRSVREAIDVAQRYVDSKDDVIYFVDGSLSSSMRHLSAHQDVSPEILDGVVNAVRDVTQLYDNKIVFVPKKVVKEIAFADKHLVQHFRHVELLKNMGIDEALAIGMGLWALRRHIYVHNRDNDRVKEPIVVGPFPLHIYLAHGGNKVSFQMDTYYINLYQWRHAVLRVDVPRGTSISWIARYVLPSVDLMPRIASIMMADEYAKITISTAMSALVKTVFHSDDMKDIIKFFPDYRGEGIAGHSIFFGG